MTNVLEIERSWTNRKLIRAALLIFLVEGLFFWALGHQPNVPPAPAATTSFHLVAARLHGNDITRFIAASAPDILAVPSPAGFSGSGWLNVQGSTYKPPMWDESPQWLAQDIQSLGKTLIRTDDEDRGNSLQTVKPAASDIGFQLALPIVRTQSSLKVFGALANRILPGQTALPGWTNTAPLLNTIIDIAANERGDVVSARFAETSGSTSADQYALSVARGLRFKPAHATSGLAFGKLEFSWQTLPDAVENNSSNPANTEGK